VAGKDPGFFETAMLLGFLRKTIESTGLRCRLPALTARVWMTHPLGRPCDGHFCHSPLRTDFDTKARAWCHGVNRDFPKSWLPEILKTRKHYRRGLFRSS
jgi:hypothetical protein